MALTKRRIEKSTKVGLYADERTLYLKVSKGGTKSWVQRIVVNGKRHDLGLGGYPVITIEDARTLAIENRRKVALGENILRPRHEAKVPTFQEAAASVISLNAPMWKDGGKTLQSWEQTLKDYAFPTIGEQRVDQVTSKDVHAIVAPLWTSKHHQGLKVRQRIGAVMKWVQVQGHRLDNPCDALGAVLPKAPNLKGHFRTVPHAEVPSAIRKVRESGAFPTTILCLEFTIVCAARPSEARLAEWSEINLKDKLWTIPKARTKMGKEHRVPLSKLALAILDEAKRYKEQNSDLVFPSARGGTLSDSTVSKLFRDNGIKGVPHAIARACFRSWCADMNVSREVAEACLAHVVKGVEASYQRSDLFERRRSVMQKWSDYLTGTSRADVIPLHG
ncbi:MAG: tyrosine-type recombinase/integrase [Nitrospira sp.]|nr:tyrosine-type recombinase/integrase [Nitrospira sp.]